MTVHWLAKRLAIIQIICWRWFVAIRDSQSVNRWSLLAHQLDKRLMMWRPQQRTLATTWMIIVIIVAQRHYGRHRRRRLELIFNVSWAVQERNRHGTWQISLTELSDVAVSSPALQCEGWWSVSGGGTTRKHVSFVAVQRAMMWQISWNYVDP